MILALTFFREVIGVIAVLERFLMDAEDIGNQFLLTALSKQHTRLVGIFDRHVVSYVPRVPGCVLIFVSSTL